LSGPYSIGSNTWAGLSKLLEEAGEVVQVGGKLLGTGGEIAHWDGSDLRVRLRDEMADLAAAIDFFLEENYEGDDMKAFYLRSQAKYRKFVEWQIEQETK
jgi:hypothetical protein